MPKVVPRPAAAGPPVGQTPRTTLKERATCGADARAPLQFITGDEPVVTPEVAAVLARIVRGLRDRDKAGEP
jgi:hypothetical protein